MVPVILPMLHVDLDGGHLVVEVVPRIICILRELHMTFDHLQPVSHAIVILAVRVNTGNSAIVLRM